MTLQIKDSIEQTYRHHVIDCAGAQLLISARSLATVCRVEGEVDAANAENLTQEIRHYARLKSPLIIDFSRVEFLGLAGFRGLLVIVEEQRKSHLHCSVIAGATMRPLLRIVTDHSLPLVASMAEALQQIDDVVQAHRQFFSDIVSQRQVRCADSVARAAEMGS